MKLCLFALFLLQALTIQINAAEEVSLPSKEAQFQKGAGYRIILPERWKKVTNQQHVEKRILWHVFPYHPRASEDLSFVHAWDGPIDAHSFLTAMTVNRDQTIGLSNIYNELLYFFRRNDITIQERGETKVSSQNCKWWILAFGNTGVHQLCFMFMKELNLYLFCFTTNDISTEQQELFKKIMQTVILD